jgi:hypothetical protein
LRRLAGQPPLKRCEGCRRRLRHQQAAAASSCWRWWLRRRSQRGQRRSRRTALTRRAGCWGEMPAASAAAEPPLQCGHHSPAGVQLSRPSDAISPAPTGQPGYPLLRGGGRVDTKEYGHATKSALACRSPNQLRCTAGTVLVPRAGRIMHGFTSRPLPLRHARGCVTVRMAKSSMCLDLLATLCALVAPCCACRDCMKAVLWRRNAGSSSRDVGSGTAVFTARSAPDCHVHRALPG